MTEDYEVKIRQGRAGVRRKGSKQPVRPGGFNWTVTDRQGLEIETGNSPSSAEAKLNAHEAILDDMGVTVSWNRPASRPAPRQEPPINDDGDVWL